MGILKMILSIILSGFVAFVFHVYRVLVVKPQRLRSKLQNQGIRGPSPSVLLGNISEMRRMVQDQDQAQTQSTQPAISHDCPSTVFPYLQKWRNEYGPVFMYSTGSIQLTCVTDIEMAKEISLSTSLSLGKPSYLSKDLGPLMGQGILSSSGPIWAHQRKIIAPELYLDKVKGMVKLMVYATILTLKSWENKIENGGGSADIKVDDDMRSLSADIISRACFGSNYSKGEDIFSKLRTLQKTMSKVGIGIPGLRYLPIKINRDIWKLEKEIHSMILEVVSERVKGPYEKDLLQMILEGAQNYVDDSKLNMVSQDKFIVDNCKNIYFAGHETTAITASWSLMLLAANPDWQARVRAEVLQICKDGALPDADMLRNMKTLTMVIQETLRLYPPAVFVVREALEDIKFKEIVIPKGMNIQIPIPMLQQNTELWGPDAHEFNPERFGKGILRACKFPQAYIPFGAGSRTCVGQNFAMIELKVILSLILSKFCFSLSPAYHHSPAHRLVLEPGNGVRLIVTPL
ncbi:cytochrome P450 714C2-like [Pistacia vera]|uniref:cytochrome P450 714C2-like n=1 Tax=Pistacia vera TaxID=55513 RepID=UPI00126300F9|nr:cytochrome P450 714C2-like [Pistacia vera]